MNCRADGNWSRLTGRLLLFVWAALLLGATAARAAAPAPTVVQDVLYRADGQVAQGMLTIRWNAFTTAAGAAVAAGELTATIGNDGSISIPLIANTGATPSGSYYRVVYELKDGTTSQEQWVVPAASATTVAAIRAQVVPQAVAAQFVSRDYVDTAMAAVVPASLVHLTGNETITGAKTFTVSPLVPDPTAPAAVADKNYVDTQIAGLSSVAASGSYNDLSNRPAAVNLSAPGSIGSTAPGSVNASAYSVNGSPISSANLSDGSLLAKTNQANSYSQAQTVNAALTAQSVTISGCAAGSFVKGDGTGCGTSSANLASPGPIGNTTASTGNFSVLTANNLSVSVASYGAKADYAPVSGYVQLSLTSGSAAATCSACSFTSADVGKYVIFPNGWTTQPFATTPSVAQIAAVNSATSITLSQNAAATETVYFNYGTDNVPAFNAAAAAVKAAGAGTVTIPPGIYLMATAPYAIPAGAHDDGSYTGSNGGSGATATATVAGGVITGYTVTNGGSGYTPSSTLQVSLSGGCPANSNTCGFSFATATTNSSGVVTAITNVIPGQGYTSAPTVAIQKVGGDGAAATATISGGAVTSVAVTSGGAGYAPSSTLDVWGIGGTGCASVTFQYNGAPATTFKGSASTNSSGVVTGVSITNAGSGCSTAPTLIFSDNACNSGTTASPVWGQCSNLAPINPYPQPVQVMMQSGVSWQGLSNGLSNGAQLVSTWDGKSVDNNEPAIFGGVFAYEDIRSIRFSGFMDIFAPYNVNYTRMSDLYFNGGIGMWSGATDLDSMFDNLAFNTVATWINGGVWNTRLDVITEGGGFFDANHLKDITSRPSGYNSTSSAFDDWFANNYWHPEFTAASTDLPETCKFPQTANQRQTSHSITTAQGGNTMCYHGISSIGMAILPHNSRATGAGILENLSVKGASRYIFYGDMGAMTATNMECEGCGGLGSDPYRNASVQEGAIDIADSGSDASGTNTMASISGCSWTSGTISYGIFSFRTQGLPTQTKWRNNVCGGTNSEPIDNPQWGNSIDFSNGLTVGKNNGGQPISFYTNTAPNVNTYSGSIQGEGHYATAGIQVVAPDGTTDMMDFVQSGISVNAATSTKAAFNICNTSSTGHCAQLSFGGTANRAVTFPDAASNTLQPQGSATSGDCVQYIDSSGVQHLTPCAATGGGGSTVTYTSSQTASTSDNGKLVQMNCSSACAYTLPTSQPSTSWNANVQSIGSTTATIALGSGVTYNGASLVPALNQYRAIPIYANTATSTDYDGQIPLAVTAPVTLTASTNAATIAVPTATSSTAGLVQPDNTTITISGGVITASASASVNADSTTCTGVSLTTTSADICNLTIPANRVPYGGVYQVAAYCRGALGSGGSASTYTPQLQFYNAANTTGYALTQGVTASTSTTNNVDMSVPVTLVAPASGSGFNVIGFPGSSWTYNGGLASMTGSDATSVSTAALVSSSGSNQIQLWMKTSVGNTNPNTATCNIVGSLLH